MREMKDSGVEWIGEIPKDWKTNKISSVYENRSTKVSDKDYQPLSVTKKGIVPQLETAAKTNNGDNRKLIKKNDFVINSRSDRRGSCGISNYDGSCSLINTVIKPRINMCNIYYSFVFRSELFSDEFYKCGNGIVDDLWSTKWSNMKNIYIPFPRLDVQHRIADYLDTKCSKIDTIIAREQAVIEKLKEYKLSVITEAVTKGLNPNVPMKDSGIEWIGEIPEHWNIGKTSYFFEIQLGKMLQPKQINITETLENYLCAINLGNNCLKFEPIKQMWFSAKDKKIFSIKKGDMLVVEGGDVASSDIVSIEVKNLYFQNALHRVREKGLVDIKILRYLLMLAKGIGHIDLICNKATIAHFPKEKFMNLECVLLPKKEQQQIVNYLDNKCTKIESAIEKKQAVINKLTEYKKSIIYEVVTGKKEVLQHE